MVLGEALKFGLIRLKDENAWLQMLDDRNLTNHPYKEDVAVDVTLRIHTHHVGMLTELWQKLVQL